MADLNRAKIWLHQDGAPQAARQHHPLEDCTLRKRFLPVSGPLQLCFHMSSLLIVCACVSINNVDGKTQLNVAGGGKTSGTDMIGYQFSDGSENTEFRLMAV